jgi:hypothetical protein
MIDYHYARTFFTCCPVDEHTQCSFGSWLCVCLHMKGKLHVIGVSDRLFQYQTVNAKLRRT